MNAKERKNNFGVCSKSHESSNIIVTDRGIYAHRSMKSGKRWRSPSSKFTHANRLIAKMMSKSHTFR